MQPNKRLSKAFENILPASLDVETYKDVELYLQKRGIGFAFQNKASILSIDGALIKVIFKLDNNAFNKVLAAKHIKLEEKNTSHKTYKKALEMGLIILKAIDGN